MALGAILLLGLGLSLFLFGSLPPVAQIEHWKFLGMTFTPADRLSWLTPSWLRVEGASMMTRAAWSIGLVLVVRAQPLLLRRLFHPSDNETTSSLTRKAALVAAGILAPPGCVLLNASGSCKLLPRADRPGFSVHEPCPRAFSRNSCPAS